MLVVVVGCSSAPRLHLKAHRPAADATTSEATEAPDVAQLLTPVTPEERRAMLELLTIDPLQRPADCPRVRGGIVTMLPPREPDPPAYMVMVDHERPERGHVPAIDLFLIEAIHQLSDNLRY